MQTAFIISRATIQLVKIADVLLGLVKVAAISRLVSPARESARPDYWLAGAANEFNIELRQQSGARPASRFIDAKAAEKRGSSINPG
jgi:hypothetical protein